MVVLAGGAAGVGVGKGNLVGEDLLRVLGCEGVGAGDGGGGADAGEGGEGGEEGGLSLAERGDLGRD